MASALPKPFAWQSEKNSKYLHLGGTIGSQKGILEFTEDDPKYIFEAEDSTEPVKIKCKENGLYLKGVQMATGENSTIWLIVATAATGEEDSTSFELKDFDATNLTFRLYHLKSSLYVAPQKVKGGSDSVLCAVDPNPDPKKEDFFTAFKQAIERP